MPYWVWLIVGLLGYWENLATSHPHWPPPPDRA